MAESKKNFDEVFEDVTKHGTKIKTDEYHSQGKYQIIDQGQETIAGYTDLEDGVFKSVPAIVFGDHTRIVKYVDEPFFLGADGVKVLRSRFTDANYRYLYYALKNVKIPDTGYNRHFKWLKEAQITYPSAERQSQIVSILDGISSIIGCYEQQLQKLDELVKARFVEMFGNPVMNQFHWRKAALEENVTLLNGRAYKQEELQDNGKYPVLRVGNFFSNRGWYYSDLELSEDKYCDNGDLLYAWSASFGPQIWYGGKVIYHYHIWKILIGNAYNKQFLCKLLEYTTDALMRDTHGIAMMHLTKSGMEKTEFIVPPIALQEQFAAFVEQTGKLKIVIQKALNEAQLLFDSLMQKYFGIGDTNEKYGKN